MIRDKFDRVKLLDPDGDYSDFEKVLKSMECVNVWGNHALWNPTLSDVTDAETELNQLSYANLAKMDQIIKDYKDFAIFKDGVCLTCGASTQQLLDTLRPLGTFWESLDPHCRWGGSNNRGRRCRRGDVRTRTRPNGHVASARD